MSTNLMIFISCFLGLIAYLFFYWKRLCEDYKAENIFSSGLLLFLLPLSLAIIFQSLLGRLIEPSRVFNPAGIWFWTSVLAFMFSLFFVVRKFRMKFFETFEAGTIGFLLPLSFLFFFDWVFEADIFSLLGAIFLAFLILFFYWIETRYKKFGWYKSGKVGFSGLLVSGVYFVARAFVAFVNPSMLSFLGRIEVLLSSLTAFLIFFALYNLSEWR